MNATHALAVWLALVALALSVVSTKPAVVVDPGPYPTPAGYDGTTPLWRGPDGVVRGTTQYGLGEKIVLDSWRCRNDNNGTEDRTEEVHQ